MKIFTEVSQFTTYPHEIAAIRFRRVRVEGDERSRSFPGHGYPAHDEVRVDYIAFNNRKEFDTFMIEENRDRGGNNVQILNVSPISTMFKPVVELVDGSGKVVDF